MKPKDLTLGAYILSPEDQTEEHIKDLAACGIDLVLALKPRDRGVLDLLYKYGVGCIVSGVLPEWWWGGVPENGTMSQKLPLSVYDEAAKSFADHPAIVGIDLGDEPSALDLDHYGKAAARCQKLFPGKLIYMNLFPNYASVISDSDPSAPSQLGTRSYEEYIDSCVRYMPLDYISCDFYPYAYRSVKMAAYFENMRIVANACLKSGRDFWYVPQVNTRYPDFDVTENCLRFQAYTAIAYGASVINWACWSKGWWEKNVLDEKGEKTVQYDRLKNVNAELRRFWAYLRSMRRTDTRMIGFSSLDGKEAYPDLVTAESLDAGYIRELRGKDIVAGLFVDGEGARAVMVCDCSDPRDLAPKEQTVSFVSLTESFRVVNAEGGVPVTVSDDGVCRFGLKTCSAVLIIFDN